MFAAYSAYILGLVGITLCARGLLPLKPGAVRGWPLAELAVGMASIWCSAVALSGTVPVMDFVAYGLCLGGLILLARGLPQRMTGPERRWALAELNTAMLGILFAAVALP